MAFYQTNVAELPAWLADGGVSASYLAYVQAGQTPYCAAYTGDYSEFLYDMDCTDQPDVWIYNFPINATIWKRAPTAYLESIADESR